MVKCSLLSSFLVFLWLQGLDLGLQVADFGLHSLKKFTDVVAFDFDLEKRLHLLFEFCIMHL